MSLRTAGATYRAVLRGRFLGVLLASVVGRLHESMVSFGVILLVTEQDSYARAGVVLAAYGAAGIVASPAMGRLADRLGHIPVLTGTAVLFAGGLVAVGAAAAHPILPAVAALAGLVTPPLTPAVRAWLPRLVDERHRLTAFALESTLQEVVFVAGPVLAGVVAMTLGPRAALTAGGVATLGGTLVCCALVHGAGTAAAARTRSTPRAPVLTAPGVPRLLVAGAGFLLVLAVVAVALVAQVSGPRAQGSAGLYLGLTSVGSMAGGLVFAARVRPGAALAPRFVLLSAAVGVLAGTAALAGGPGPARAVLGAAAFLYGTAIAPVGAVLFGRLSEAAGDSRATEAFGWMGAAMGVGAVLGDAAGGWLVTVVHPGVALAVAAAVGVGTASLVEGRRRGADGTGADTDADVPADVPAGTADGTVAVPSTRATLGADRSSP